MSRQQQEADAIFDIKNAYYIGDYQQCINEAQKTKITSQELVTERQAYMYRAYIAQGKYRIALDEIKENSDGKLQYVRALAEFLSHTERREELNKRFAELSTAPESDADDFAMYRLVLATMYYKCGYLNEALEACFDCDDLEVRALSIQIYLELHRTDLARGELKKMLEKDEDATVTQLAQAWVHIAQGGDKLQEAYYIYQELIDKYDATPTLLNGQAVVYIGQGKYASAEEVLRDAVGKDNSNADTHINMIVLAHHQAKPEMANRHLSQLKEDFPNHQFVRRLDQKVSDFQRLCKMYAPAVETSS